MGFEYSLEVKSLAFTTELQRKMIHYQRPKEILFVDRYF